MLYPFYLVELSWKLNEKIYGRLPLGPKLGLELGLM